MKTRIKIGICLVCMVFIYLYAQNNWIKVETIEIFDSCIPDAFHDFKIVHISDTHLPKHAASIKDLIKLVKRQNPDMIVITGDSIDSSADILECGLAALCGGLSEICEVYAVSGNHEYWNGDMDLWKKILQENHVTLLEQTYIIVKKDSQKIAIMGLSDGVAYSDDKFENMEHIDDLFTILLAHRPELFETYSSDSFSILPDVVFSGHAHGGQFRIPLIGGVIAPNQGLFPSYTSGLYSGENETRMIVSRGLGNSVIPIRINNRPHLPVIILKNKE